MWGAGLQKIHELAASRSASYAAGSVEGFAIDSSSFSNALEWGKWLSGMESTYAATSNVEGITVDLSGFIYITGYTTATSGFSISGRPNSTLTGAFVAKYNSSFVLQWGSWIDGNLHDYGYSVAVDLSGNVFLKGSSSSTSGLPSAFDTRPASRSGMFPFLAKFDSNGICKWGKWIDVIDDKSPIMVHTNGDVYVIGHFYVYWAYVYQYNTSGILLSTSFVRTLSESGTIKLHSMIIKNGNFYICGIATGPIAPNGSGSYWISPSSPNTCTFYITTSMEGSYGNWSDVNWINNIGTETTICVSSNDIVYISSSATNSIYSRRLNESVWNSTSVIYGIKKLYMDTSDNIYIIGYYDSTSRGIQSVPSGFSSKPKTSTNGSFVAKYKSNLSLQSLNWIDGNGEDYLNNICVSQNGSIYTVGNSSSSSDLPALFDTKTNTTSVGFVAKFSPDYFQAVKDFNALYQAAVPYIDTSLLAANIRTVLSYIDSNGAETAAWTSLADKSTILTNGETAYIDLANIVTAAFRAAYSSATTAISGFALTDTAANSAGTVVATTPADYVAANTQLQTYVPKPLWISTGEGTNSIAWSTDGKAWTGLRTSIFSTVGYGAAWNGSVWVAAGQGTNTLAWSTDGKAWTGLGTSIFSTCGYGAAWNGSVWVAAGQGTNTLAWSNDGKAWTGLGTSIFSTAGYGAAWNGSLWVATGQGTNTLAWSTDGKAWTGLGTSIFSTRGYSVAWNGSLWVAAGQGTNTLAWSTDGKAWTGLGTSIFNYACNIAWNGSLWVAVGQGTNTLAWSTDGKAWTGLGITIFKSYGYGVAWNGSLWVATGRGDLNNDNVNGGIVAYSANGKDWTRIYNPTSIFSSTGNGIAAGLTTSYITSLLAELKNKVASMMATYLATKAATTITIPAGFLLDPTVDQPNIDMMVGPTFIVTSNSNTNSSIIPGLLTGATTTLSDGNYVVTGEYIVFNNIATNISTTLINGIQLPIPKRLIRYIAQRPGVNGIIGQRTAYLEGSFNGTNWVILDQFDSNPGLGGVDGQNLTFNLPTRAYSYYRLRCDNTFATSRILLYEYKGIATDTKQDQLIQIYNKYKTANDGIQALAFAATFKTVYEAARRFITDDALATSTIDLRNKIYTGTGTYALSDITTARQDIMKTLITRYFLMNPGGSTTTLAPSVLPTSAPSSTSIVPAPSTVTSSTTLDQLAALESTYLTGTGALWPSLLDRIRTSVQGYIETYKTTRDAGGITSGSNFYANTACDADKTAMAATNFTKSMDSSGEVVYSLSSGNKLLPQSIDSYTYINGWTYSFQSREGLSMIEWRTASRYSSTNSLGAWIKMMASTQSEGLNDWPYSSGFADVMFKFPKKLNINRLTCDFNFKSTFDFGTGCTTPWVISASNDDAVWDSFSSGTWTTLTTGGTMTNTSITNTSSYKYYKFGTVCTVGTSKSGVYAYNFNLLASADSEYSYISNIYNKYASAIGGILSDVKTVATNALTSFTTMYTTTLLNCRPITSSTDLQTAITNYGSDQANIDSATTIASVNTFRDRYRAGVAALFLQVRSDQLAIADKYIKLYNKYLSFRTNSAITAYGVTMASLPTTSAPDATTDRAGIAGLPTTVSATSLPTNTQVGVLQSFCNNYGDSSGFYANLVAHIRTNLLAFIAAYDNRWNALSADVKRTYSYTSPVSNGAFSSTPSDADLYDYMNQYAGFTRDTLTSTVAAAPTTSYTSTITTATSQADALALVIDFGNMYVALRPVLEAKADSRLAGITAIIGAATTANTVTKIITDVASTTVATGSAALVTAVTLVGSSAFTTARSNMIALAQDNMNAILSEYRAVWGAHGAFREAFSGVAELPTLAAIDADVGVELSSTAAMSGLIYAVPTSGNYTQTTVSGLALYGNITNYADFAGYVTSNANKLQGLVSFVQGAVNGFQTTVGSRITGLTTSVATDSLATDSYATSMTKSGTLRGSITSLGNEVVVWFMKLYWVDTWITGRRYLSDANITAAMISFATKCETYLTTTGTLKVSPFVLAGSDSQQSLMNSAATALRDASIGLAMAYNTAWTSWITGRSVVTTANTPVVADRTAGTDAVRMKLLGAGWWPTILGDIKTSTSNKVTAVKELQDWLRNRGSRTVRGVGTTGLGQ